MLAPTDETEGEALWISIVAHAILATIGFALVEWAPIGYGWLLDQLLALYVRIAS